MNAKLGGRSDERPRFSLLERPPFLRYYIYSEMQKWGLALDERPRFSLLERPPFLRYYIYSECKIGGWRSLMNWNLRNLDHFTPEIVQTYDLERRKENDQFNGDIPKE